MITNQFCHGLCEEAKFIRTEVFIKEQGFENEFDVLDETALHIVVFVEGSAAATARMLPSEQDAQSFFLGRIAVLRQYRKLRIGSLMLQLLEDRAKSIGAKRLELSAQCRAQSFYEKNGFVADGEPYLDEFCEHIHMEKEVN